MAQGKPPPLLRPTADDLRRVEAEIAEVNDIQQKLCTRHPLVKIPDRAAHQYQLMGGKVLLRVATELPSRLLGVGLFVPGVEHFGVSRLSTSLGVPHPEDTPDFLGIRGSFLAANGQQVDFFGMSSPAVPVDHHRDNMDFLRSTADGAGPTPIVNHPMTAANALGRESLYRHMGRTRADMLMARVARQNARAATFSTAFQPYWTGVVEINGTLGKFTFKPLDPGPGHRPPHPGAYFLTRDWERRQAARDIRYGLHWIAYIDEARTPLERFAQPWEESHMQFVAEWVYPRTDLRSDESRLWAELAAEMDANPGNWITDVNGLVREPSTEFGLVRKLAYERSAKGRDVLRVDAYRSALVTRQLDDALVRELRRRMKRKRQIGHRDRAPD